MIQQISAPVNLDPSIHIKISSSLITNNGCDQPQPQPVRKPSTADSKNLCRPLTYLRSGDCAGPQLFKVSALMGPSYHRKVYMPYSGPFLLLLIVVRVRDFPTRSTRLTLSGLTLRKPCIHRICHRQEASHLVNLKPYEGESSGMQLRQNISPPSPLSRPELSSILSVLDYLLK